MECHLDCRSHCETSWEQDLSLWTQKGFTKLDETLNDQPVRCWPEDPGMTLFLPNQGHGQIQIQKNTTKKPLLHYYLKTNLVRVLIRSVFFFLALLFISVNKRCILGPPLNWFGWFWLDKLSLTYSVQLLAQPFSPTGRWPPHSSLPPTQPAPQSNSLTEPSSSSYADRHDQAAWNFTVKYLFIWNEV